ncbi:hypothetical protein NUM3379_24450 [Kineococcus sp. NUM-3379]
MIRRRLAAGVLAALATATALAATPAAAEPLPAPDPALLAAQRVVELTNAERAARGCPALTADPVLGDVAARHSSDMALSGRLSHVGSDGSTPGRRLRAAGYRARAWAENAAWGHATAEDVVRGWLDSPPHRANLLSCHLRAVGVGLAGDPGAPYWTLALATPR